MTTDRNWLCAVPRDILHARDFDAGVCTVSPFVSLGASTENRRVCGLQFETHYGCIRKQTEPIICSYVHRHHHMFDSCRLEERHHLQKQQQHKPSTARCWPLATGSTVCIHSTQSFIHPSIHPSGQSSWMSERKCSTGAFVGGSLYFFPFVFRVARTWYLRVYAKSQFVL